MLAHSHNHAACCMQYNPLIYLDGGPAAAVAGGGDDDDDDSDGGVDGGQHVPVAVSARTEIAAVADHSERESSSYRYKHVPLIFQVNIPADHEVALRQQDIHVDVLPVHHFIPASENECSGGELYGFSGWHCQTRSFLRARTCGLQSLRLLSFRAIVVSSHLLYATLQMQKVPRG
ncbi:uncharacterized protein LOC143901744 isoform X2 [Temnothorax americanus]|uniref:uncharacterized protein LOC143901744 isoform X2 n=1 Tax=Temnothorax americanus TaxID=1964332 RepID=UPI0040681E29